MQFNTGDLLVKRSLKPNLLSLSIRAAVGSDHEHDELIRVTKTLDTFCGLATIPHFHYIPLQDRIDQYNRKEIAFAVYRWTYFCAPGHSDSDFYKTWKVCVGASLDTMSELKIPYDKYEVLAIGRNVIRSKIPLLGGIIKQKEHRVYCTESCQVAYNVAGTYPFRPLGYQPYVAPVHVERLIKMGAFTLIADFGFH